MIHKVVSVSLAVAVQAGALLALVQNGQAQTNLLPVTFSAVCTSTNSNGLVRDRVNKINLIDDCAVEHGLTNLDHLSLVFNVTNFSVQVVDSNGVPLCTSLALTGGLAFTNTNTNASNTTQIVFQKNVLVDTNQIATGVASGFASWKNSDLSSFRLTASLLYIEPASGTNGAEICSGVLTVGRERNGEDEGEGRRPAPGSQGNDGNSFGGQNQHSRD